MGLSLGEIMVIAIVGLIFIGPKDMPRVMRDIGQFIRKIKNMGDGFMQSIESELTEPKKYIKDLDGNLQETFSLDDLTKK